MLSKQSVARHQDYLLLGVLLLIRSKMQTANKLFRIENIQAAFLQRSECCLKLKNG